MKKKELRNETFPNLMQIFFNFRYFIGFSCFVIVFEK